MTLDVDDVFAQYNGKQAEMLQRLRSLILEVADNTEGVGEVEECLKWGQPSFVTKKPKSGSTIRIDAIKDDPDHVAMYFICTTNLVEQFRNQYPDTFTYSGNRALIFDINEPLREAELRHCVAKALTYHL